MDVWNVEESGKRRKRKIEEMRTEAIKKRKLK